jgi:hypothetical protein
LISSWNLLLKSWRIFGRVSRQSMLLVVKNLHYMLRFFGAYMIIQHSTCCVGESGKDILPMCIVTRILAQRDWRTRYITLGIVIKSTDHPWRGKESDFDGTIENQEKPGWFTHEELT